LDLRALRRVIWSIVGAGGVGNKSDLEIASQLAQSYPNLVGVSMDDFFRDSFDGERVGTLTPKELAYVQNQIRLNSPKLDLWVTLYRHDLKRDLSDCLSQVNVVTFWTRMANDLETLEDGFAHTERSSPKARKILGCRMWDYSGHQPIPLPLMKYNASSDWNG
jgi:hypothetical protein